MAFTIDPVLRQCLDDHMAIRFGIMVRDVAQRMDVMRERMIRDQAEIILQQERRIEALERRLIRLEETRQLLDPLD